MGDVPEERKVPMDAEKLKKIGMLLAVTHFIEACIAARVARKKGKNSKLYFMLTLFLGVFVLVPLRRSEPEEPGE